MTTEIQTSGGVLIDIAAPENAEINIVDVAEALSRICRFVGHLRHDVKHYSVAQHCVLVAIHCEHGHEKAGLLHDAAEAYLGDISTQLKSLMPEYKALEQRWDRRVEEIFKLPKGALDSEHVKRADLQAIATESRDLQALGPGRTLLMSRGVLWPSTIYPAAQAEARSQFLKMARSLGIVF